MRRCPECRRSYTDETLNFCLDDGAALVDGPASIDEPATALISPHETESKTRTFDSQFSPVAPPTQPTIVISRRKSMIAGGLVLAAALGFGSYYYYAARGGSGSQINSIAVMPFVNVGGNADVEYLSDGITESLMNDLSQLSGLSVKARSSVFRYKGKDVEPQQAASDLKVQAVLNGRVTQRGDSLVVSLDLVDGASGNQIWGEQYSRKMGDLAQLQTEIARDVSQKLRSRLTGAEENRVTRNQTQNAEAYQLYLQGRYNWNKRTGATTRKAIEYFQQAVDKDPNYALGYVGLAESYVLSDLPTDERFAKVKAAALKALEIDPSLGEPHAALGSYHDTYKRDFAAAEREFRKAIELNPNYATAYHWLGEMLCQTQARFDEGLASYRKALEIEPFSMAIGTDYAIALYYARRYDEAIDQLKKLEGIDPTFVRTHMYLAQVYEEKGQFEDALNETEKRILLQGNVGPERLAKGKKRLLDAIKADGAKGYWSTILEFMKEDQKSGHSPSPSDFARIYTRLGDSDQAFAWIERAQESRDTELFALKVSPEWDNLRDDPRFPEALRKSGLAP